LKFDLSFPGSVASIDIGTNTILLLVAETKEGVVKPLFEEETIVRLGEGLQRNGVLSAEAMKRGLQTLSQYLDRCHAMGIQRVFAVGTSALREARNSEDFLGMVKDRLNLPIEVVSGEEEAELSFLAAARDLGGLEKSIFVVDVGGGSTEFVQGKADRVTQWTSLPMGSVRSTEKFLLSDPVQEAEWKALQREIRKLLANIPRSRDPLSLVAVGGTATTLASVEQGLKEFIPEKIHHFVLEREALRNQLTLYRSQTLEQRKTIPGLSPARADVILAGGAILYLTMEDLGFLSTVISCHGVRYGLLYKKIANGGLGMAD